MNPSQALKAKAERPKITHVEYLNALCTFKSFSLQPLQHWFQYKKIFSFLSKDKNLFFSLARRKSFLFLQQEGNLFFPLTNNLQDPLFIIVIAMGNHYLRTLLYLKQKTIISRQNKNLGLVDVRKERRETITQFSGVSFRKMQVQSI